MKKFKPDVVLGMGGFASGPGGIAAKLLGIPLVLHEQNAVPGVTNKLLSHISAATLCAFDNVFPNNKANVQIVGNPVRPELIALGKKSKSPAHDALKILVVGGSLGAKVFNDILPNVIANLSKNCAVTIWHQVGKNNESWVKNAYQKLGLAGGVKVSEFIDDMEAAYQWADIVICRCGALTVSELAAVGLPSILVPYPYAVDDHQTINASVLVKAKAAFLIQQQDLTVESLSEKLNTLADDPQELASMGNRASSVAVVDSTEKVAKVCEHLATKGLK